MLRFSERILRSGRQAEDKLMIFRVLCRGTSFMLPDRVPLKPAQDER